MICFDLCDMEAFLFDLDGCLYYGDVPANGARELLEFLKEEGKRYFYVTNNSTHSALEISVRLNHMGLPAAEHQVITATELTGLYIKDTYGIMKLKVAGSEALRNSLELAGHYVLPSESQEAVDIVVVGRDIDFHYRKLQWIVEEVQRGAKVIGTNSDTYHLGSQGVKIPETGALISAIETILGKSIECVGKPNSYLFQYVVKTYHINADACVMIGDNINTDILGGIQAGMHTVWIKSEDNEFVPNEQTRGIQPDLIVGSVDQVLGMYQERMRKV